MFVQAGGVYTWERPHTYNSEESQFKLWHELTHSLPPPPPSRWKKTVQHGSFRMLLSIHHSAEGALMQSQQIKTADVFIILIFPIPLQGRKATLCSLSALK